MSRVADAMRRTAAEAEPRLGHDHGPAGRGVAGTVPGTRERFPAENRSVSSSPDTEPAATKSVSRAPERHTRPEQSGAPLNPRLVISPEIPTVPGAQYRRLAAAFHDMQLEHGLKIVMVSSAVPQEGKTLTITNLALTLSESYHRRVLLVDADLRRPTLHEMFGVSKTPGLADILRAGGGHLPLVPVSPWLELITAGQPDLSPLAQLTSDQLRAFVNEAAERFDWVLLDTPPISLLPDAQHVASVSQGVLFVIAAGVTPYPFIQDGISAIGAERIVGAVLNYAEDGMRQNTDQCAHYYDGAGGAPAR